VPSACILGHDIEPCFSGTELHNIAGTRAGHCCSDVLRQGAYATRTLVNSMCARLESRYANTFQVGHNAFEFLLQFGQCDPDTGEENLHTRVVTSPQYAKVLLHLLADAMQQYERANGPIEMTR
jgi:hypothetical protein